ncbi:MULTISPECIES: DUF72 domain-containing protein [unclassified Brevundimonas]|uniref:DUF72 domain-containing protein n=1 Tax=unclassified Brevundimonas TaxID=2622653 RepID=UPI000CFE211A|nr:MULTISPECIES: DUF72 domain-containing protein [unclassified Brevundimonas]PRA33597.1 hypothetical protein CQ024_04370 [Brevundimonas sp. MYb27]PQZ81813.1 hypothetical protein CQ026_08845 [Brevundimonas sp. MYb31]PRB13336.1 hypothetical protein CQ039_12660 [Brevundimonas sp. MYb52]PRB33985.1 hypothetical protein CQ035_11675 [Brevundimonas sp. MYb46]PRB52673.1 hypothetical protein CQ028_05780 [Brevundimonas sp. MYb33]
MAGAIRVGVGGWTFEPWRGVFYPDGLTQKRELEFASRALTSIEINGTYYSTFKTDSWMKWRDETPEDFVFAVKASRYCTNRKVLSEGGESFDRFLSQGLTLLGDKLGPINWQFMGTKKFDAEDFEGFLKLLPREKDGVRLRHALEVRNPTFACPEFYDLALKYCAAIVYAVDDEEPTWPQIDEPTADFSYARLMSSRQDEATGMTSDELEAVAVQARRWAERGDVFAYLISGAKVRNPAAAQALIEKLK